jgi:hypothetical protein
MALPKYYSKSLKNKIAKKCMPQKLVLCHGKKCRKYNYLKNRKNLYLDAYDKIEPDINMNIHNVHKIQPLHLKSKFNHISSIHAPLGIFFNKHLNYLHFTAPGPKKRWNISRKFCVDYRKNFCNKNGSFSVNKFLKTKYFFNRNFIKSLLYLLNKNGKFEFVDNFIFESCISDKSAIKLTQKLLGIYSKYFDVYVSTKSDCLDYTEKAKQDKLHDKFIVIKKIKDI